jgi:hypothetical protein
MARTNKRARNSAAQAPKPGRVMREAAVTSAFDGLDTSSLPVVLDTPENRLQYLLTIFATAKYMQRQTFMVAARTMRERVGDVHPPTGDRTTAILAEIDAIANMKVQDIVAFSAITQELVRVARESAATELAAKPTGDARSNTKDTEDSRDVDDADDAVVGDNADDTVVGGTLD